MTTASKAASAHLAGIAGAENVIADEARLAAYQIDGRIPAAAVRAGSSEEVAEIVRFAAHEGLAIVPSAARTKISMGRPPRQYDLAVDLTRLDRVIAYDPEDLTLSVAPGITLRHLAAVLARHRQFLPLAVPFASRATVGGTIASGIDSPLRQLYGTARDFVLGMEFVTGEGVHAKSGGRVVKNVSGYDLHKLMIGSLGTLGIITRVNFRTFPVLQMAQAFAAHFETLEGALAMHHRMAQSPLRPITLDILSPGAVGLLSSEIASRIVPGAASEDEFPKRQWVVTVTFAGNEKTIERYSRELRRMAELSSASGVYFCAHTDREAPPTFLRLREFVPIALDSSPAATIIKVSTLPTHMKDILVTMARAGGSSGVHWAALARGVGVIYVALLPSKLDESALRSVIETSDKILAACRNLRGNFSVPWCPAKWKAALKVWGGEPRATEQMRKLKQVFDPCGTLSPGRFVGGI